MIKRAIDLVFSLLGLVVLLPIFAVVALAIVFYDGGPVFFIQKRVGRGGTLFSMLKFRTMVVDGHVTGAALTVGQDSRVTKPGKYLRGFKLDELPQLWNVLCGQMSLVGPRPEVSKFVELYSVSQREVLRLKPGITDPASFAFFDESELLGKVADPERFYREQLMGEKIRINLEYAARANVLTDLVLVLATVGKMVGVKFDVVQWLGIELPQFKMGQS